MRKSELDSLFQVIRREDSPGRLSVEETLNAAHRAQRALSRAIENLGRIRDLDLEIGDLVETDKGGGIVKRFDADGTVVVDFPREEKEFASEYFAANRVSKPTPKQRFQHQMNARIEASLEDEAVRIDEVRDALEEILSRYRAED